MRYLNLEVENWGPFRGKHSLDLRTTPDKPMILIFGENGKGKTSLTDAIRWCLYGPDGSGVVGAAYANRDEAARNEQFDVAVTLKFSHDIDKPDSDTDKHEVFEIRRSFTAKPHARTRFKVQETRTATNLLIEGKPVDAQVISSWIEALMPREMSRFFIFDGEELIRLKEAIENGVEGVIQESLASVMGVPAIVDLEESLRKVQKQIDKQIQTATANDKHKNELSTLGAMLEKKREERDQTIRDLEETVHKKNDLKEAMLRSADTKKVIEEQSRLEAEQKEVTTLLSIKQDEIRQFLHDNWWVPLSFEIKKTLEREARGRSSSKKRQELEWQRRQIKLLLDTRRCATCHQPIHDHSDFELQLKKIEVEIDQAQINETSETAFTELFKEPGEKRILLENQFRESRELLKRRNDLSVSLRRVNDQLVSTDKQSVLEIAQRWERESNREGQLREVRKGLDQAIDKLETDMEAIRKRISRDSGIGHEVYSRSKALGQVLEVMRRVRDSLVGKVRKEIEDGATRNFLDLVQNEVALDASGSDYTGLVISEKFEIRAVQKRYGEKQNLNYGHSMLVVYAFVAALISVSDAVGAWIIDTPGARLDQGNLESVWRFLSAREDQVIVFPHSNELTFDQAGSWLGDRISARYQLVSADGRDSDSRIRRIGA